MNNQANCELIERYLQNELTLAEKELFEQRLAQDHLFAQDYQLYIEIGKTLAKQRAQAAFKKSLQEVAKHYTQKSPKKIPYLRRVITAAAAIIILIGISILFYYIEYTQQNKPLVTENTFNPHTPQLAAIRSSDTLLLNTSKDTLLFYKSQATQYFQQKNYSKAIPYLQKYLQTTPNDYDPEYLFAYGYALYQLQQTPQAIKTFQTLKQHITYKSTGLWYLAACYAQQKDTLQQKNTLQQIDKNESPEYYQAAQKILNPTQ